MKVKIIINTLERLPSDGPFMVNAIRRSSEVWSGELEILRENEYLVKLSVIGEGEPQPIAEIPFSPGTGYYLWVPGVIEDDQDEEEDSIT